MAGRSRPWACYGAAAWGFLFAVPSFYWASGGRAGAATTVSPQLVQLATDRVAWFVAVLWITGGLKVLGGLIGLALTRPWRPAVGLALLCAGAAAGVLLAWHGGLFILAGGLVEGGVLHIAPDLRSVDRWYTYLWGPWFLLGGLLFLAAVRHRLATSALPRGRAAALTGGLGALLLSAAMLLGGLA